MIKKPLAIGVDDFKELIGKSYYYIDKTLLIKELIDNRGKVSLFTRPRRFGKTLTLSMIRTFFEMGIDNRQYFENLDILSAGEIYTSMMGCYPVINLSLKSAKQPDFEMAYCSLIDECPGASCTARSLKEIQTVFRKSSQDFSWKVSVFMTLRKIITTDS